MQTTTSIDIDKLAAMGVAAVAHHKVGGTDFLIVPTDYSHVDITALIEKAQPQPNRKAGTIFLSEMDSFLRYAKDQAMESAGYLYADPDQRTITAIFNDNQGEPGWRDHRAIFKADTSRELAVWLAANKKPMEQEEFAIFLEDNIADVVEPAGDVLLQVALSLQAKTEASFSSVKRLDNGQVQLSYSETIDARASGGAIDIPREFKIGMRLFKNGEGYAIKARLKYRLHSGRVKFWFELDRPENAIEAAFTAYVEKANESGYTVLFGKP